MKRNQRQNQKAPQAIAPAATILRDTEGDPDADPRADDEESSAAPGQPEKFSAPATGTERLRGRDGKLQIPSPQIKDRREEKLRDEQREAGADVELPTGFKQALAVQAMINREAESPQKQARLRRIGLHLHNLQNSPAPVPTPRLDLHPESKRAHPSVSDEAVQEARARLLKRLKK